MKTVGRLALSMLVMCSVSATSRVDKEDLCEEADHFLSYPFDSSVSLANLDDVTLDDEFTASPELFTIVDAIRLLNPATKWHRGKKLIQSAKHSLCGIKR
jgi:hypothetical protein